LQTTFPFYFIFLFVICQVYLINKCVKLCFKNLTMLTQSFIFYFFLNLSSSSNVLEEPLHVSKIIRNDMWVNLKNRRYYTVVFFSPLNFLLGKTFLFFFSLFLIVIILGFSCYATNSITRGGGRRGWSII
jgi:hypothetical protein